MLQATQGELEAKEAELQRRQQQLSYQDLQIQSLRQQVQALMATREQQAAPLHAPPPPPPAANNDAAVEGPVLCDVRCKVCLSAESNTIFQPCHHVSCCSHCAAQLFTNGCPVCRAPIASVLPAYIS